MALPDQNRPVSKYCANKPEIKKKCLYCETEFLTRKKNKRFCKPECADRSIAERYNRTYIPRPTPEGKCRFCGKSYTPEKNRQYRYCSPKCKRQAEYDRVQERFRILGIGLIESKEKDGGTAEQVSSENT